MKHKSILLFLLSSLATCQLLGQNSFVIEPYIQNVTDSSFHVLFETSEPCSAITYLSDAGHQDLSAKFRQVQQSDANGLLHNVVFDNLEKGVYYLFRVAAVAGKDTLWGTVTPYTVPDFYRQPIVCAVVGDTQKNPVMWGHLAGMIARERPSFVLHVGDMVGYGPRKSDWTDEFFRPAKDLFGLCPLYPVLGNHEMNVDYFYQYFDVPEPKWFYTQKKGNALFVFVHTDRDIQQGSRQYRMLEQTLASSREQWKIVLHHHTVYKSEYFPLTQRVFTSDPNTVHLRSLYEIYGVDLVLSGHNHNYERSMPVYQDEINDSKGVTYIVTGGGGGELDETSLIRTWFMAETKSCHHYVKMTINNHTLTTQAIDSAGIEFDRWVRVKDVPEIPVPLIDCTDPYFLDRTEVVIHNPATGCEVVWKIDDGEYRSSTEKEIRFNVSQNAAITAYTKNALGAVSRPVSKTVVRLPLMTALKGKEKHKVRAEYYENYYTSLPDFDQEKPLRTFVSDSLTLNVITPRREDHWAARFRGRFTVPETKVYRLLLESYDGSRLLIDGKEIIDNDGMHHEIFRENMVALEKGEHDFEVQYFDFTRRETLHLWMNSIYDDAVDFNGYILEK